MRDAKLSGARSEFRGPRKLRMIGAQRAEWAAEARALGDADASAGRAPRFVRTPCMESYFLGFDACLAAQHAAAEQAQWEAEQDEAQADLEGESWAVAMADRASY